MRTRAPRETGRPFASPRDRCIPGRVAVRPVDTSGEVARSPLVRRRGVSTNEFLRSRSAEHDNASRRVGHANGLRRSTSSGRLDAAATVNAVLHVLRVRSLLAPAAWLCRPLSVGGSPLPGIASGCCHPPNRSSPFSTAVQHEPSYSGGRRSGRSRRAASSRIAPGVGRVAAMLSIGEARLMARPCDHGGTEQPAARFGPFSPSAHSLGAAALTVSSASLPHNTLATGPRPLGSRHADVRAVLASDSQVISAVVPTCVSGFGRWSRRPSGGVGARSVDLHVRPGSTVRNTLGYATC